MTTSLQKGIEAARTGLMQDALAHLKEAVLEEPDNANVWVWLSAVIDDEDRQTLFLRKALEIDPYNLPAQRGIAFLESKKTKPPKPGETLADHTRPIGLFRPSPVEYVEEKQSTPQPQPSTPSQKSQVSQTKQPKPKQLKQTPVKAEKEHVWVDILLYTVILGVFIVIGILVGSTFFNIELPFLSTPTPMLASVPPQEGVYLLVGGSYEEMKTSLGLPESKEGIPQTTQGQPSVVINSSLINIDTLKVQFQNDVLIPFQVNQIQPSLYLLEPYKTLTPGRYCLIHMLNPQKEEALFWCFEIIP